MPENELKPLVCHHSSVPICAYQKLVAQMKGAISPHSVLRFLTFHFSLLILIGCGFDVEDPTPPSPPVWVEKSLPEEWPERGIDAVENGGINLEWEIPLSEDVKQCEIFRAQYDDVSDSLGEYMIIAVLESPTSGRNTFTDINVLIGQTYFYMVKSVNWADRYSDWSDPISYRILRSVRIQSMSPNGSADTLSPARILSWYSWHTSELENYTITLLKEDGTLLFREVFNPTQYTGGDETYKISESIALVSGERYSWRVDVSARLKDDVESAGAESLWARFRYPE